MPLRCFFASWLALAAFLTAAQVFAQLPTIQPVPPTSGESGTLRPIRESGPPALYLKSEDGLRVYPSTVTMEKLDELLALERRPSRVPPEFTFPDNIRLVGTATDQVADLKATIRVRVPDNSPSRYGWVRIPLRFNQAILSSPVALADGTELDTEFDAEGDGYIAWLNTSRVPYLLDGLFQAVQTAASELGRALVAGDFSTASARVWMELRSLCDSWLASEPHEYVLQLHLKVPVTASQGEKQLVLFAPPRPTELHLTVASPQATARDATDDKPVASRVAGTTTEFIHEGAGNNIHLAWRDSPGLAPVKQAEGKILLRVVGRKIDAEAQLFVRSFGEPIDSFDVRLPAGSTLVPGDRQLGIDIFPASRGDTSRGGPVVTVRRRDGKTSTPIEIRLKAILSGTGNTVDVSGFEVLGAQIQRGVLEFSLSGDATIDWRTDANVTRIDVPDSLRAQQVVARFEYDQQPFSLQAVIGRAVPRINVDPTYAVTLESERITLDGRLRYRIRSAREERLVVESNGWELLRIGPPDLLGGPVKSEGGVWEIPLANGELTHRGEFELQFSAEQPTVPLEPETESMPREVSFLLPRPRASAPAPAVVVVSPADNIELTPLTDRLQSLIADTGVIPDKLPARQQPRLVYREELGGPPASFAGVFETRRQALSGSSENLVRVVEREWSVEQRFIVRIRYEPASQLVFDAPREIVETGELETFLDGSPVVWSIPQGSGESSGDRQPIAVELREKRIGPCEVLFRYRRPHARNLGGAPVAFSVPLVRFLESVDTTVTQLRVSSVEPIRLSLVDDQMRPMEDATTGATVGNELSFRVDDDVPPSISLVAMTPESGGGRTTVVERLWVQTLMTSTERRDRACFFLNTTRSQLAIELPEGAIGEEVQAVVNGQPAPAASFGSNGQEVRIDLGNELGRRQLTVELWYWFHAQPAAVGRLNLEAPRLAAASRPERAYWELRLPSSEHLVWSSAELISENTWRWHRMGLSRSPQLSQVELEEWVHATPQDEPKGFNTYLFSSIGSSPSKLVVTAVRPLIVLIVAGGIFLAGVAWLYVPAVRHPVVLLAFACLLLAAGVSYPDPAIAASQFIALGLALVALTRVLMALLPGRPQPRATSRGSTFGFSDSRSSKTVLRRIEGRGESAPLANSTGAASFQMSAASDDL